MTTSAVTPESSLLLTLEEISQLIAHSRDPAQTLGNIVRLIQGRFGTDVCSVYFLEPDRGELVLGATIGLQPSSVGQVRMGLGEGLTGLAAQTLAPVVVEDAFQHPRFKYFPEAGEDPYHSFLGIPLIESGVVQGVLVVQTVEPRRFTASETRMLVTVAAQLAPLVGGARMLARLAAATHAPAATPAARLEAVLEGVGLSPGAGAGTAFLTDWFERSPRHSPFSKPAADEPQRLARALEAARDEVLRQGQRISAMVGEEHGAILQAHLMLLQDRTLEADLLQQVSAGRTAEEALLATMDHYVAALQKVSTPFTQERVYDIKDVFRRVLWQLRPRAEAADAGDGRLVLVAREASVMDLFAADFDRLAAVVVERGGAQSHAAILARSLGVPMVGQVPDLLDRVRTGQPLLVDGGRGIVTLDPAPQPPAPHRRSPWLETTPAPPPDAGEEPRDDLPRVDANINLLCEVGQAVAQGARGVGLYRTEFLFLARRTLPTEEEQVGLYRKLLSRLRGRPASIRTFDLRPDKLAVSEHWSATGGALDWRRVLESPPLQKLFKEQVRAILRAATAGPARILVPLMTRTELLDWVRATLADARAELRHEGLEHGQAVPLGVMIEAAGAAWLVGDWARHVDFFAVGTNDLVASALGVDRDDPAGGTRDDFLHPGVLQTLRAVLEQAHAAGRPVTVCGEMASDPVGLQVLAALGVDALSVPVQQLGPARWVLRRLTPERLDSLAGQLGRARTAAQARALFAS